MMIEIRTAKNEAEEFEHEGYYNSINEAIARLKTLEQDYKISPDEALRRYKIEECDKCVWSGYTCPGPVPLVKPKCPQGFTFKRDPPDGGYYG